jgi:hypothetical protein
MTALTVSQQIKLFKMLGDLPYTTVTFRLVNRLGTQARRFDDAAQIGTNTKTLILDWLNQIAGTAIETELLTYITNWTALEANFAVMAGGTAGAASGMNYNPADERRHWEEAARQIVPFWREYQVQMAELGDRRQLNFAIAG